MGGESWRNHELEVLLPCLFVMVGYVLHSLQGLLPLPLLRMLSLQGQSTLPTTNAKPRPTSRMGPLRKDPRAWSTRHQPNLAIRH